MNCLIITLYVAIWSNSFGKKLSKLFLYSYKCFICALHATTYVMANLSTQLCFQSPRRHISDGSWRDFQRGSTEGGRTSTNVSVTISWGLVPDWIERRRKGQVDVRIRSLLYFWVCVTKSLSTVPFLLFHDGRCFSKPEAKISPLPLTFFCKLSGHSDIHPLVKFILDGSIDGEGGSHG